MSNGTTLPASQAWLAACLAVLALGVLLLFIARRKTRSVPSPSRPELVLQVGHCSPLTLLDFSTDGETITTVAGRHVIVWDARTGEQKRSTILNGTSLSMHSAALSPDHQTLAVGESEGITIWNARTGAWLRTVNNASLSLRAVKPLTFSPDGGLLAGDTEGRISVWKTRTWEEGWTTEKPAHRGSIQSLVFSHDGAMLASSAHGEVALWDSNTGKVKRVFSVPEDITFRHGMPVSTRHFMTQCAFSRDDRVLAAGSWDKKIWCWDATTGALLRLLEGHDDIVNSVAFSPDGRTVASCIVKVDSRGMILGGEVRTWDWPSGKLKLSLDCASPAVSVTFAPDGRSIAVGLLTFAGRAAKLPDHHGFGEVELRDPHTGGVQHSLKGYGNWVSSIAFSPDGNTLLSGSWDKTARVWDTRRGGLEQTLDGHTLPVTSVAFSSDGETAGSASLEARDGKIVGGTVKLWDARTGERRHSFFEEGSWVESMVFCRDDGTLLIGAEVNESEEISGSLTRLDLNGRKLQRVLLEYREPASAVVFSPDGDAFASGTQNAKQNSSVECVGALRAARGCAFAGDHLGSTRSLVPREAACRDLRGGCRGWHHPPLSD